MTLSSKYDFSYADARRRYLNDALFYNIVNMIRTQIGDGTVELHDYRDAVRLLEVEADEQALRNLRATE